MKSIPLSAPRPFKRAAGVLLLAASLMSGCASLQTSNQRAASTKLYSFHASAASLHTTSYYATTARGVVVFDAPLAPTDIAAFEQEIRINSAMPITHVVVTSAMPERYGGAGALAADSDAHVLGTASTQELISAQGAADMMKLQETWRMAVPTVTVDEIEALETGETSYVGGVKVLATTSGAGPTRSMTAVYLPDMRTLVAGGLVFNHVHPRVADGNLDVWIASLEELAKMEGVDRVFPGSGSVGGPELIQSCILYLRDLAATVAAQAPFERPLTPELGETIKASMEHTYEGWSLTEALELSIQDEWLRQGGFPSAFATEEEAAPLPPVMLEGEPEPGETDSETLPPLFGLEPPAETTPEP